MTQCVQKAQFPLLQDRSFLPMRQEGEKAFEAGKLRSDCPYADDSGEAVHWDAGWRDAYQRNS